MTHGRSPSLVPGLWMGPKDGQRILDLLDFESFYHVLTILNPLTQASFPALVHARPLEVTKPDPHHHYSPPITTAPPSPDPTITRSPTIIRSPTITSNVQFHKLNITPCHAMPPRATPRHPRHATQHHSTPTYLPILPHHHPILPPLQGDPACWGSALPSVVLVALCRRIP